MEIVKRSPDFGKEVLRNIEVILNEIFKFNKSNINSLSLEKDKSILVQTFVYVLLSNLFIFGQTIDASLIKL